MRYLVLSDVHANLEALEAVLADTPPYDGVLFLGDLVGYGPNPNECVERVRELPRLVALVGNHDLAALGRSDPSAFNLLAREAALWTGRVLSADNRDFLIRLQPTAAGDEYLLAHGSPVDPVWEYLESGSQAKQSFRVFSQPVCFVGHTHVPRILEEGCYGGGRVAPVAAGRRIAAPGPARLIINPGGVGQPRDGDPRASYGLWDTDARAFYFRRVPYPVAETQRKMLAEGLPPPLAHRLAAGL